MLSGFFGSLGKFGEDACNFLTGANDTSTHPVKGVLGYTGVGAAINLGSDVYDFLTGGNQSGNEITYNNGTNTASAKEGQKPTGYTRGNKIVIETVNINTEDDPEKIKTALMNLIIELQEQVSPRIVSRTIGEPPAASTDTTEDTALTDENAQNDPNAQNNNNNNNNPIT